MPHQTALKHLQQFKIAVAEPACTSSLRHASPQGARRWSSGGCLVGISGISGAEESDFPARGRWSADQTRRTGYAFRDLETRTSAVGASRSPFPRPLGQGSTPRMPPCRIESIDRKRASCNISQAPSLPPPSIVHRNLSTRPWPIARYVVPSGVDGAELSPAVECPRC
jgi:hypothetical protein